MFRGNIERGTGAILQKLEKLLIKETKRHGRRGHQESSKANMIPKILDLI